MLIGKYNKSVILTYIGVTLAVVGMYLAFHENVKYAMLCLAICGVCDLFDGKIARMCKRTEEEKQFGVEIDSLADMVNFIALPIAIFFSMGLNQWYHVVIYVLYTLAAIERLGYFNIDAKVDHTDLPVNYYTGLPVTFAALIFSVFWFFQFCIGAEVFKIGYSILILLTAILFVLKIKVAKPRGIAYVFLGLLAIVVSVALIII